VGFKNKCLKELLSRFERFELFQINQLESLILAQNERWRRA
jgi:hypothetical protein